MINTFLFSTGHSWALIAYTLASKVLHSTHPNHINLPLYIAAIKLRILTHNLSRGPLRLLTLLSTQEILEQSESLWMRLLNVWLLLLTTAAGASYRICLTEQSNMGRNKAPHVQQEFPVTTEGCQSNPWDTIHSTLGVSMRMELPPFSPRGHQTSWFHP